MPVPFFSLMGLAHSNKSLPEQERNGTSGRLKKTKGLGKSGKHSHDESRLIRRRDAAFDGCAPQYRTFLQEIGRRDERDKTSDFASASRRRKGKVVLFVSNAPSSGLLRKVVGRLGLRTTPFVNSGGFAAMRAPRYDFYGFLEVVSPA